MKAPIVTVDWSMDLMSAKKLLYTHKLNFLPVLDDQNFFFGIITSWDLLQDYPAWVKLKDIAKKEPVTISQEESCQRAAVVMLTQKIHHLLVVDPKNHRKLVGVLSSFDILEYFIS